jgi:hypothetical protein
VAGGHVDILVAQGGDGWSTHRRQFGRCCHAGEQRRGDLGEERADSWAPSVSDDGAVTGGWLAHAQRWAKVGAELGRS